ncbi:hypothetical protein LCGC14_0958190 [marine sediment metagenome]|uniref:Uncharacterized protein n=1 Tax=marine sediment metagenome TaxID=412755 RepID=A0A0F9RLN6_9ZZZZ
MRTKQEILNDISKEASETLTSDPTKQTTEMLVAFKNGDLKASMASSLADVLSREIDSKLFIELSREKKRLMIFKAIFSAIKLHNETERIYEEQFKISEEK